MKSTHLGKRIGDYTSVKITSFIVIACFAITMPAATLDNDVSTAGNVGKAAIPLAGGTQNVSFNASAFDNTGGYLWGDRMADNSNEAVTPPGLDLGAYTISNTVASSSIQLDLNGGNLVASSGAISIAQKANRSVGNITVYNVGNIEMGDGFISASHYFDSGANYDSGGVFIGQDGVSGPRAGKIQIARVDAGASRNRGAILIYSSSDVLIKDASGEPGDLINRGLPNSLGKNIEVLHQGNFLAETVGTIEHARAAANNDQHEILFNGWVMGGGTPEGKFKANKVVTTATLSASATNHRKFNSDHIKINNYSSVVINDISTATDSDHATLRCTGNAGNITINAIAGDISITGMIDASSNASGNPVTSRGELTLQCNGSIKLAELDLDNVKYAQLSSGSGNSLVEGALSNFDSNSTSGSGTAIDPLVTTQTNLRTASGQKIFYRPDENIYLDNKVYKLADLAGIAGNGGVLTPEETMGTVIIIQ